MIRHDWKPDEDAVLRKLAKDHSAAEIGEVLNRTARSVEHRARRICVKIFQPKRVWTPDEDAILHRLIETHTIKQMMPFLYRRGVSAIQKRLTDIGLAGSFPCKGRRWTQSEIDLLGSSLSNRQIADIIGKPIKSIGARRRLMYGVQQKPRQTETGEPVVKVPAFTPADELAILQAEYPGESYRNYRIPSEGVSARRYSVPLAYSPTGSSAAMCVGTV